MQSENMLMMAMAVANILPVIYTRNTDHFEKDANSAS